MLKLVLFSLFCLVSISYSQTNNICNDVKHSEPVTLNFVKNESGEIVLKINGHFQQFNIQIEGAEIAKLYKEDTAVNLTQAGFDSAILAIDTKSGSGQSQIDSQAVIPPVNPLLSPTPPLATPY